MEEERVGFVENSKIAVKGVVNGIIGSFIYELLLSVFISIMVSFAVASKNSGATKETLESLTEQALEAFPFSILVSCIGSIITLIVFAIIIKFDKFKEIFVKLINLQTLKYGAIGALCIMGFSIFYNSFVSTIFELGNTGNANQENVVELIKSNLFLGFLSVVILAPIVEELTYRYCLFGGTCKKRKWVGYLISGIVFAFMHSISSFLEYGLSKELLMDFLFLPPYLFSGLALCYLYDKSSNLGSSFVAHLLNNLISFLGIVCL